jgi:hypothetical protein
MPDYSPASYMLSRPPSALSLGVSMATFPPQQPLLGSSLSSASQLSLLRASENLPFNIPSRPPSALSIASLSTLQARLPPIHPVGAKRKRKPDDEKEERNSKRIATSQGVYRLSEHQDVALKPTSRITVARVQELYQLPDFLADYQASTFQASNPIDRNTLLDTWQSIRLFERQRRHHPEPTWRRVQACPPSSQVAAQADPVLYTTLARTANETANASLAGE